MNALQNDPKPGTSYSRDGPVPNSTAGLARTAKPFGVFVGSTEFIVRFLRRRNGRSGEDLANKSYRTT